MMHDKGGNRTVWALTRRVALSIVLIGMIVLGIWMGWLQPHGIGG
jgi:F0F1-type ATP synthase assembly protein I